MDTEAFVRWALDSARTLEERFTTELVVEQGVRLWEGLHSAGKPYDWNAIHERERQRKLNPAYQPTYSEESLRKTAEIIPHFKHWHNSGGLDSRPVRDLRVFQFLTSLEDVSFLSSEVEDISVLAQLPNLRKLSFASRTCEDYRPLGRCTSVRDLTLILWRSYIHPTTLWPNLEGLEQLTQLQTITLEGNLLAFPRNISWPNVKVATLLCAPVTARNVRDLPQLPACEFLTLGGIERLDGIDAFPQLRNLRLDSDVRDFAPLEALKELTCFSTKGFDPLDLKPLTRLPKLAFAKFDANFEYLTQPRKPRDYSTLLDAPNLREVVVENCRMVKTEVGALNAGLPSWDDLFLRPEPRPLPTPRLIVAPYQKIPQRRQPHRSANEPEMLDKGLRECEGRWVEKFITRTLNKKLGAKDWGEVQVSAEYRTFTIIVESLSVIEKFPKMIDAGREIIARLQEDYVGGFQVSLKAPKVIPTQAQIQLEKQFEEEQDRADYERRQREQEEYLERLHRYELLKQEGQKIKPEEFAPGAEQPLPPPPWEREEEEEDDSGDADSIGIAVKKKPDPPPGWLDDEHPLAAEYYTNGAFTLSEVWFMLGHDEEGPGMVRYLMGRPADEIIPAEKKKP